MIVDRLENAEMYLGLHPAFEKAFEFLRRAGLSAYADGRYEIEDGRIFVLVSSNEPKGKGKVLLEAHRKYLDIQVSLDTLDCIGYKPLSDCRHCAQGYDAARDCEFFSDAVVSWFELDRGSFAVFFPSDAHAPLAGVVPVRKAVIKVPVW
ncbi:MAG: YhcH/YjgK/YiaL family protein [Candidatus Omnitrophota bacterium]|nr:YhcH/YjgK/YiaL family protein [Candidatus Omnitrophota bacterium]